MANTKPPITTDKLPVSTVQAESQTQIPPHFPTTQGPRVVKSNRRRQSGLHYKLPTPNASIQVSVPCNDAGQVNFLSKIWKINSNYNISENKNSSSLLILFVLVRI